MAIVRPFRGYRPQKELAEEVAALPYDVLNTKEAREVCEKNPYSFLHIDKAEVDLPKDISPYDKKVYEKARDTLLDWIEKGVFFQEKKPVFYIYRLGMDKRVQTGLVVCTSIEEYLEGKIKKHELTRADKEEDRIRHVDYCNAQTGPIFLAYKGKEEIQKLFHSWCESHKAEYDFTKEDGIRHSVWVIYEEESIKKLTALFAQVDCLYIADGHHRNASAVKVGLKRRQENPTFTGQEEFNYYLSVLFPTEELKIFDYNRVVKDLNGYDKEGFLKEIAKKFEILPWEKKEPFRPRKKHEFGLYLENKWYCLTFKKEDTGDVIQDLDVSILQNEILTPVLGIHDPRTDTRIDFVGGIRGLNELEKRVNEEPFILAFSLYPTSMEELMQVADEGKIMPPKSTWFEPKLRSGLFIHSLEE